MAGTLRAPLLDKSAIQILGHPVLITLKTPYYHSPKRFRAGSGVAAALAPAKVAAHLVIC
jgi:hypothetical protein